MSMNFFVHCVVEVVGVAVDDVIVGAHYLDYPPARKQTQRGIWRRHTNASS